MNQGMHHLHFRGEKGGSKMMDEDAHKKHSFLLEERKKGMISGVEDVISFDETMALLDTTEGRLTIKGSQFHVNHFDLSAGKISFEGIIESFAYSDTQNKNKKGQSFWARLFQ